MKHIVLPENEQELAVWVLEHSNNRLPVVEHILEETVPWRPDLMRYAEMVALRHRLYEELHRELDRVLLLYPNLPVETTPITNELKPLLVSIAGVRVL
jgi:hypothetical protein